jgi:hypothetical protein
METVDADKVGDIQLPLKEIMAIGDGGAYRSGKEFLLDHIEKHTYYGISFRGFPSMPATKNEDDDDVSALASDEPIGYLVTSGLCRSVTNKEEENVDDQ